MFSKLKSYLWSDQNLFRSNVAKVEFILDTILRFFTILRSNIGVMQHVTCVMLLL